MKYLASILFISATVILVGCTITQPVDDSSTNLNQANSADVTNTATETNVNESDATIENVNNANETISAVETDTADDTAGNTNDDIATDVDTSDWLTYTNEEYGFSFKYPEDWEVDVVDENDEGVMGLSLGSINLVSNSCRAQGDKAKAGTIDQLKQTLPTDSAKKYEEISSNGVYGIQYYDVVNENGYKGYIHLYDINDNELNFRLVDNPTNEECQQIFDQIMSTIKLDS